MRNTLKAVMAAALLASVLAGCSQGQATGAKADQKSSETANNNFVDGQGKAWTSGDKATWQQQLKHRAQGQNDYVRAKSL